MDNSSLLKGVGLAALVTVAAAELGILHRLLGTTNLTVEQWAICIVLSLGVLVVAEVVKALKLGVHEVAEGEAASASAGA
jgi:Ca2+-transporting ATPase